MDIVLELLKYIIPALIVFLTARSIIKSYIKAETDKRAFDLKLDGMRHALPLRLQAYERLTLFLERITPVNLIRRVRKPKMNAFDLQMTLLNNIKVEYEHNLSQQIYVSIDLWMSIRAAKEETITIINRVAASLPQNVDSMELSKRLYQYFIDNEQEVPTERALKMLVTEVKKLL